MTGDPSTTEHSLLSLSKHTAELDAEAVRDGREAATDELQARQGEPDGISGPRDLVSPAAKDAAETLTRVLHDREHAQQTQAEPYSSAGPSPFLARLHELWQGTGEESAVPRFNRKELDLERLWFAVQDCGGYEEVCDGKLWARIGREFDPPKSMTALSFTIKKLYEKHLHVFASDEKLQGMQRSERLAAPLLKRMSKSSPRRQRTKSSDMDDQMDAAEGLLSVMHGGAVPMATATKKRKRQRGSLATGPRQSGAPELASQIPGDVSTVMPAHPDGTWTAGHLANLGGAGLLGQRVFVLWPLDATWYCGYVTLYDAEEDQHTVIYDDGWTESVNLAGETFFVLQPHHRKSSDTSQAAQLDGLPDQAKVERRVRAAQQAEARRKKEPSSYQGPASRKRSQASHAPPSGCEGISEDEEDKEERDAKRLDAVLCDVVGALVLQLQGMAANDAAQRQQILNLRTQLTSWQRRAHIAELQHAKAQASAEEARRSLDVLAQSMRRPNPSVIEPVPDQKADQRAQAALSPGSSAPVLSPIPGLLEIDNPNLPGQAPHELSKTAKSMEEADIPGGKAEQIQTQAVRTYAQGHEQELGMQETRQCIGQGNEAYAGQTAARSLRGRPEEPLEATGVCTLESWGAVNVPCVEAPGKQTVSQVAGTW